MDTFAPLCISSCNSARCCRRHIDNLKPESINDLSHFFADIPAGSNDQRFGDRASRDKEVFFCLQHRDAGICFRIVEQDRH